MTEKNKVQIIEQLDEETRDVEFTAEMMEKVMRRSQTSLSWWQREIRIHVPATLAVGFIGIVIAFWLLNSSLPEPSPGTGPLIALDSGIFLESELRDWLNKK
ncbi:hypothetical protein [Paenibacillus sp. 1P07SE]|uniref:hypothetical protein n=1 Tax=Paenibacillus sp. 1P07SE TaxID=3132209 RepID=UPI0039A74A5F